MLSFLLSIILLTIRFVRRKAWSTDSDTSVDLAPVLVFLVALFLFFPPSEWVLADGDPGIYYNIAESIVQTGSLTAHYNSTVVKPDFIKSGLVITPPQPGHDLFYGFTVSDASTGTLKTMLFHLWPVWIAIFIALLGPTSALYVVPLFAILSVVAFFLFLRETLGQGIALASALALGSNFLQIFFAKSPASEMLGQALLMISLATLAMAKSRRSEVFAVLSGLSFAQLMFVKLEFIIIVVVLLGFLTIRRLTGRSLSREESVAGAIILSSLPIYAMYISHVAREYTLRQLTLFLFSHSHSRAIINLALPLSLSLVAIVLPILVGKFSFKRKKSSHEEWNPNGSTLMTWLIPVATLSLALAMLSVQVFVYGQLDAIQVMRVIASLDWRLWLPAAIVACIGAILLIFKPPRSLGYFIVILFLIELAIFSVRTGASMWQPWYLRRYVPVILPFLSISIGYGCFRIAELTNRIFKIRNRERMSRLATLFIFLLLLISSMWVSRPLLTRSEYKGVYIQAEQIAAYLGDDYIMFGNDRLGQMLGTTLRCTFGTNALVIYRLDLPDELVDLVNQIRAQGLRAFIVDNIDQAVAYNLSSYFYFIPDRTFNLEYSSLERPRDCIPQRIGHSTHIFTIYEALPYSTVSLHEKFSIVDVGGNDFFFVKDFHDREAAGSLTYRWTKEVSYIKIPMPNLSREAFVSISMSGYRPPSLSSPVVRVSIGDSITYEIVPARSLKTYRFKIPEELWAQKFLEIKILSQTFVPNQAENSSSDSRNLGVLVDEVSIDSGSRESSIGLLRQDQSYGIYEPSRVLSIFKPLSREDRPRGYDHVILMNYHANDSANLNTLP
jgi:hypothetical protein